MITKIERRSAALLESHARVEITVEMGEFARSLAFEEYLFGRGTCGVVFKRHIVDAIVALQADKPAMNPAHYGFSGEQNLRSFADCWENY
jgi:hypothetical protein